MRYFCGTSDTSDTSDTNDTSDTSNTANSSDASKISATVTWLSSYLIFNKNKFSSNCASANVLDPPWKKQSWLVRRSPMRDRHFGTRGRSLWGWCKCGEDYKVDMLMMILEEGALCRIVLLGQEVGARAMVTFSVELWKCLWDGQNDNVHLKGPYF